MKKLFVLTVVIILLCLSACSKDSISNTSKQPVEITFWHAMSGDLEKSLQKMTTDFNTQKSNVHVTLVNQGNYSDLHQKLMAAGKSNQSPILSQTYADWNDEWIKAGIVENLNPYITDSKIGWTKQELEDIYPVFREENQWGGNYYSLPFNKSIPVLFYNKTMLDESHVNIPTTWDEWREASRTLTKVKADGKGKIVGTGFENSVFLELYNYVLQAGGEFYNVKTQQPAFNSPEGREGVAFVSDMMHDGTARLAGEDQFMSTPFGRGDVAMYVGSSAGIPFVGKAVGNQFSWSTAVLPKGKKSVAYVQGTNITMFHGGTDAQKLGAWMYMKYLLNKENSAYWAEQTGYLPVRTSVSTLDSYAQFLKVNPAQAAAPKQLLADRYLSRIPNASAFEPVLSKEMEAILRGKKSVEQGLFDAEQVMKEVISQKAALK
ncbi:ABC transporter substrate-binding protein [Paenibacillus sp. N3.4]|uniref:ABC transporter substrate-binding protein n=1 Tax=Paenibacillus sp. N3.4 TaxID=2603222 RepID=UPI0011CADE73|nr:ABC transporter substrate-binding protein [Paenibacillus sp. N3.4]TXK85122.1 ABC transporter substrate-binding protein [Paenibacillus sp. N3.4]